MWSSSSTYTKITKTEYTLYPIFLSIQIGYFILMFIGPCIIAIVDEWKTNLMSLVILFHFLVLNMFRTLIYPSSRACDCVDELPHRSSCSQFVVCWSFCCGWYLVVFVLQAASACKTNTTVLVLLKINTAVFVCNCCGRRRVLNIQGVSEIGGLILDTWSVDRNFTQTCPRTLRPP